jgi:WD40 repeat protein/tetratricopeptide (TPR) repeat protein
VAFSADSKTLWTGAGAAQAWDVSTARPVGPPLALQGSTRVAAFSPDCRTILTESAELSTQLWDATTRAAFGLPLQHQAALRAVAFSPDGKTMIAGYRDRRARLWDVATGTFLGFLEHQGTVEAVAFSFDGKTILTSSEDGTTRLWDASWRPPFGRSLDIPTADTVYDVSLDGRRAVSLLAGSKSMLWRLWNVPSGKAIAEPLPLPGSWEIDFSPDGKTLMTIFSDRTIRPWNAATGEPLGPAHDLPGVMNCTWFSPDSKAILAGGKDGRAWIWDVPSSTLRGIIPVQRGEVDAVGWSPDGRTFATGLDIAEVQVWDAATFTPLGDKIRHPGGVGRVLYSPDGNSILISGEDGTARLWDLARREARIPPLVHDGGYIYGLDFSPDGKMVASGGDDKQVRFWDTGTGQPIGPTWKRENRVLKVAFQADGKSLLTRDLVSGFRFFPVPPKLPDDPDRLAVWVEVIAGLTLDPRQGLIKVLDNADWLARRKRLNELGGPPATDSDENLDPILFGPDPTVRARVWMERKQWNEALAAFDEVIRARPLNAESRVARGEFFSVRGEHEKSAADFAFALDRDPNDAQMHYRVAMSMLVAGDLAGYRSACAGMLNRFQSSEEVFHANRVAFACIYGPDAVVDMPSLVRVARRSIPSLVGGERILGAVLYRAGRYQEALKCFDQSNKVFKPRALDYLFMAMAHGRLGHAQEARRMLAAANQWIGDADTGKSDKSGDKQSGWSDEQEKPRILLLLREAKEVVLLDPVFPTDPFAH